jgi:hypothetical protein
MANISQPIGYVALVSKFVATLYFLIPLGQTTNGRKKKTKDGRTKDATYCMFSVSSSTLATDGLGSGKNHVLPVLS